MDFALCYLQHNLLVAPRQVQAVMLLSVVGAKQIDVWVARQQRKQLGLCEQCGGIYEAATCQQKSCPSKQQQL